MVVVASRRKKCGCPRGRNLGGEAVSVGLVVWSVLDVNQEQQGVQ